MKLLKLALLVSVMAVVGCTKVSQDVSVGPTAPSGPSAITLSVISMETSLNTCNAFVRVRAVPTPGSWEWDGPREGASQEITENGSVFTLRVQRAGAHTITAVKGSDRSQPMSVVFTGSCPGGPTTGPGSFTLNDGVCSVVSSSTSRATLSWTSSAGAIRYRVERRVWSTGSWVSVGTTESTSFSHDASNDADSYYRVVAIGSNGGETLSSPAEKFVCQAVNPPTTNRSISISPSSGSGNVGTTQQVTATCRENGNVVSCSPIWTSSAAHLVAVNSNGLVSYSSPGTAKICATWVNVEACGDFTAQAVVAPPAPTVDVWADPGTIPKDGTTRIYYNVVNITSCTKTGDWSGTVTSSGYSDVVLREARTYNFGLTCTGPGGTASDSTSVIVTAPGCPTSISYEVVGGTGDTIAVNQTKSLRVRDWIENEACQPFWYVSDPSKAMVIGADRAITIEGRTYYAGVNGAIRGVWTGTVQVCVQTSIVRDDTKECRTWTVTASSGDALMRAEDVPQLKFMNRTDFAQTFSGLVLISWY